MTSPWDFRRCVVFSPCAVACAPGKIIAGEPKNYLYWKMKKYPILVTLGLVALVVPLLQADTVLFEQNFESLPAGPLPKEFLPLAGEFAVITEGGARFLQLPGSPLDTFGVLFGPSNGDSSSVEGRFQGTKQGRKFPTFGLSLRGAGGYRLQVSPGKGQLEIYKGDDPIAGVPFVWESGAWICLKLSVKKMAAGWVVEGRAWKDGSEVPAEPQVKWDIVGEPPAGRAAIWGSPYSGTPISFDDLRWTAH